MGEREQQSNRYYVLSYNLGERYGLVRIHVAECGYGNDERGTLYGPPKATRDWQGPLDFESASHLAESLAVSDTRPCQRSPKPTPEARTATGAVNTNENL